MRLLLYGNGKEAGGEKEGNEGEIEEERDRGTDKEEGDKDGGG